MLDPHAHNARFGSETNECLITGHTMRGCRAGVRNGFDKIRFALTIATHKQNRTRLQRNISADIVAEVGERKVRNVHAR